MKIFDIFKKKVEIPAKEIEEISVIVKEYTPKEEKKFIDIDLSSTQYFGSKSKVAVRTQKIEKKKDRLIVKINSMELIDSNNFMFIDYSKIDGYPVYEYLGENPSEIMQYSYEEIAAY